MTRQPIFDFRWICKGLFWLIVVLLAFLGMVITGIIQVERGYAKTQVTAEVRQ